MRDTATEIIAQIRAAGYGAWFVGGAVRDMLSGRPGNDIDLMTTARPEILAGLFPDLQSVGKSFGVSLLRRNGFQYEIATAREERNYLDGRHPEEIRYTDDPAIDVERRDFTVNALLYDPLQNKVIDFVGGIPDLKRGIIRTVGDPDKRFSEDYLRMLRAIRFAARLRFIIEPETAAAIQRHAFRCAEIAPERVRVELNEMLIGPDPARAIRLLLEHGVLPHILPEVAILDTIDQPPEYHPEGNVFAHTMLMLEHMKHATVPLAWSVLLHDVGKAPCMTVEPSGRIRFFGHEVTGAKMAQRILERLRFSNKEIETITQVIRRHMHFVQVGNMRPDTLSKLLGSPTFALEMELNRLDCISCHGLLDAYIRLLDEMIRRKGELELPQPLLRGRDLVAAGFKPDRRFGKILRQTYDQQLAGKVNDYEEALRMATQLLLDK